MKTPTCCPPTPVTLKPGSPVTLPDGNVGTVSRTHIVVDSGGETLIVDASDVCPTLSPVPVVRPTVTNSEIENALAPLADLLWKLSGRRVEP
jgi:hypothetical protein